MKKAWVLSYPLSAQRRLRSDWADAQADPRLRWPHSHFVGIVMRWLIFFFSMARTVCCSAVLQLLLSFLSDYSAFPRYSQEDTQSTTHMPLKKLVINLDYHLLVWLLSFSTSVGLVYINNITTVSKSLCTTEYETAENASAFGNNTTHNSTTTCLSAYDDRLTIIVPITNALVSLSVGLFSDHFRAKLPRLWILILGCVCFLISQIIALLLADKIFFLMLATVFAGTAIGIVWSLAPTVMKEVFFVGNLGRNWGIAILVAALLGFGIQEIYGALYDAKITVPGSNDCFGMQCIRGGVTVCLVSASVSIAFGILMQFRKSCNKHCAKPL